MSTINLLTRGETVYIDVATLFSTYGGQLTYTEIWHYSDRSETEEFFDLYRSQDETLAIYDGEPCTIESVDPDNGEVTFKSDNGDCNVYFTLTAEETEIALSI